MIAVEVQLRTVALLPGWVAEGGHHNVVVVDYLAERVKLPLGWKATMDGVVVWPDPYDHLVPA